MRTSLSTAAVIAASSQMAAALTPIGSIPAVNATLGVAYNRTLIDGTQLFDPALLQTAPNVSYVPENTTVMALNDTSSASTSNGTYMLLMIDLSLPASRVTLDPSLIVPGLEANDSTRLHWWQGNLTSVDMSAAAVSNTSNLTTAFDTFLVPSSPAVARYQGPAPPAMDGPHYYVFYLFDQPANYTLPANVLAGNYSGFGDGRANFNVTPIIEAAGEPLAATFLQAENGAVGISNATVA